MVKLTRFSGIVILALLTASCSDRDVGVGDAIATPERALPEIVDNLLPKGFGTQDFLIHLDLQVLNEVEEGESIYQQVLDKAKEGAAEATPLFDGILFRPTDSIRGIVRDDTGGILPSISVNFGLLSIQPGQVTRLVEAARGQLPLGLEVDVNNLGERALLVEFSTADLNQAPTNVRRGDVSEADLTFVTGLEAGDSLRSIYFWGQTLPPADPSTEADLTPHEVFASRWNAGQVRILGDSEDGVAILVDERVEVVEGSSLRKQVLKVTIIGGTAILAIAAAPPTAGTGSLIVIAGGGSLIAWAGLELANMSAKPPCTPWSPFRPFVPGGADDFVFIEQDPNMCARSTGDIHMETFDGLRYEFQTVGEFVVVEDDAGEVTIQFRLEARGDAVSVGTAVAASVDGVTVAIHVPGPKLYVDGQLTELERGQGMSLGDGGGIVFTGTSYVIGWPDGTALQVNISVNRLDITVSPGAPGKFVGLFGDANGSPVGDLITRDGEILSVAPSVDEVYARFGESWRVSQDESLLHYATGESTETFTNRDFPLEHVTLESLDPDVRAGAERSCRKAGITSQPALDECTFDVAVTGDLSFVLSAALVAAIHEATGYGSVEVEFPDGVAPYNWAVVSADDPVGVLMTVPGTQRALLVPQGEYRVTTKMGQFIDSVVWPDIVRVEPGDSINLGLQSTIQAEFPDGVAPYNWAVVSADDPVEVLMTVPGTQRALLVPPGEYRVTTKMGQFIDSVVWPDIVLVEAGESVSPGLRSTIQAEFPDGVAPYNWAVVSADESVEVLMTVPGAQRALLVPPGEYRVTTKMGQFIDSVVWPDIVLVEAGESVSPILRSTIQAEFPDGVAPYNWAVVSADDPVEVLMTVPGTQRALLVPPGEYRVTTKMGQFIDSVVWPDIVRVEAGESVSPGLRSTIQAEFPDGVAPYNWAVVSADDPVEVLMTVPGAQRALLVPPGEYRVTTKMGQFIDSVLWPDIVRVEAGESVSPGLRSTIQAEFPDGVVPYNWAVVSADDPVEVLMTVPGTQGALLVPPGEYRVTTKMGQFIDPVVWPDIVRVAAGRVTVVRPAISPP